MIHTTVFTLKMWGSLFFAKEKGIHSLRKLCAKWKVLRIEMGTKAALKKKTDSALPVCAFAMFLLALIVKELGV